MDTTNTRASTLASTLQALRELGKLSREPHQTAREDPTTLYVLHACVDVQVLLTAGEATMFSQLTGLPLERQP